MRKNFYLELALRRSNVECSRGTSPFQTLLILNKMFASQAEADTPLLRDGIAIDLTAAPVVPSPDL